MKDEAKKQKARQNKDQALLDRRGKNRGRHLTCMTPFRPARIYHSDLKLPTDNHNQTCRHHSETLRQHWEERMLSQLTRETVFYIKHNFDDKSSNRRDSPSVNESTNLFNNLRDARRKRRLFDLHYTDDSEPNYIILL